MSSITPGGGEDFLAKFPDISSLTPQQLHTIFSAAKPAEAAKRLPPGKELRPKLTGLKEKAMGALGKLGKLKKPAKGALGVVLMALSFIPGPQSKSLLEQGWGLTLATGKTKETGDLLLKQQVAAAHSLRALGKELKKIGEELVKEIKSS